MRFHSGDRLGPYLVRALVGSGAMGEVYRASDPRLKRDVAIKVMSSPQIDREALDRFAAETHAVAALSHPNIITIHDVGEVDGLPYAVMELLEGQTLRERIATGPLTPAETLAIATQVTSALAAAHAAQIVHRDLKPANVFVLRSGSIKILDFGVAKVLSQPDLATMMATMPGLVIGTVGYMAPEQVRGQELDARADVFAFGALLYEMATGVRAFHGQTAIEVLAATIDSRRPGFEKAPHVPEPVRRVIRRCLEVDPARRFGSGAELLASVERLTESMHADRQPDSSSSASSIAVLPFTDMSKERDQEYLCEGMAEEIITGLSGIRGLKVASRTAAFRFRDRAVDLPGVAEALNVACVLEGSVRTSSNRLRVTARLTAMPDSYLRWSKTFDCELTDIFAVEDEIARAVVAELRLTLGGTPGAPLIPAATGVTEAYTAYLKGRYHWNRRTGESLQSAIECFTEAIAADSRYAKAYAGLADAYATLAVYGLRRPHDVMPTAKTMALQALGIEPDLAEAYASLALVDSVYDWSWSQAQGHFARAISLAPDYATAFQWYAVNCLVPCGRFEEARSAIDRAVAIDPVSLPITISAGLVSYFSGQFEDAAVVFRRALALDPTFGPAHFFLGQALSESGASAPALYHAERAAALSGQSPETLAGLGYAAAVAGDDSRARSVLDELTALSKTRYVSPSVIAQVQAGLGQPTEALESLRTAQEMRASDLAWVAVRPTFRTLRSDARFVSLIRRLGLNPPP
jgi:TolB-like protein/tRNA A-37 threonylcarbamoyl transferase component Bud32/cytochrome c-type biogenesis protein CcmH/NrfG